MVPGASFRLGDLASVFIHLVLPSCLDRGCGEDVTFSGSVIRIVYFEIAPQSLEPSTKIC